MNPLYEALSLFRRKRYEECRLICTANLKINAYDQAFWVLKMRCFTQETYIDDIEFEEEGIAETLMDENAISTGQPKTALPPSTSSQSMRPVSQYGRPISGVLRPGSQSGTADGGGLRLNTARTSHSARPLTSGSLPYHRRLGTASMLPSNESSGIVAGQPELPSQFLQVSRLNLPKYAQRSAIAKPLLQFIADVLGDTRSALQLASVASELHKQRSWWWLLQHGKCLFRLGLLRQAERELRAALRCTNAHVDCTLWLARLLERLKQPSAALDTLTSSLNRWPGESALRLHAARLNEQEGDLQKAAQLYKQLLNVEPVNSEAIACIALQHFYEEQPELALRYYRRVLQMSGSGCARLYINLALCCFYAQQLHMVMICVQRALQAADSADVRADCWYNAGGIALASGDRSLAIQCFRLAVVVDPAHAEAYNNLGVLEMLPVLSANRCAPANQLLSQANLPGYLRAAASAVAAHQQSSNDSSVTNSVNTSVEVQTGLATSTMAANDNSSQSSALETNQDQLPKNVEQSPPALKTGVQQLNKRLQRAKTLFQTSVKLGPHLYEPHYNLALLSEQLGQYELCHTHVKLALTIYPTHHDSITIYERVRKMYEIV